MATNSYFDLDMPEAHAYATLTSARNDFRSTFDLCNGLKSECVSGLPHPERAVLDAFSTAIVVRYCRAFPPGLRDWPWKETLAQLSSAQRTAHEKFRNYRNKHFSHSVNALEENKVQARFWIERLDEEGVESISCASTRLVGLHMGEVDEMINLCSALLEEIDLLRKQEAHRLLTIVRKIPLEKLKKIKNTPFLDDSQITLHRRRKQP